MQQGPSGKLGRLEIMVGGIDLGVGAGLLARPAPTTSARSKLALFYRLATHCLD